MPLLLVFFESRVRLAWAMLTHDWRRLALSITGVAFAVFLMFIEMGFLNGVYDSQTYLVTMFDADAVMLYRLKDEVYPPKPFPKERLALPLQFTEVQSVAPIYMNEKNLWRNPETGLIEPILVLAFDPQRMALMLPNLTELQHQLLRPDTALIDEKSRDFYGVIRPGTVSELNGRRILVGGTFSLGPNFRIDGNLLMSDRNYARFVRGKGGGKSTDHVEFGLIKLAPGADVEEFLTRMNAIMPSDVRVVSKSQLAREVRRFWAKNQPVGTVFGLGMVVGFIIGVTICYQILFTDIVNHLAEFATLKAIGYPSSYLVKVVIEEGALLALFGFLPGLLCSLATFSTLEEMTGILMRLTWSRVAVVFAMTLVMCLLSAAIAIRKVLAADPAEVF